MRILMLAHRIPYPPRTGEKLRAFHVARHLAHHHDLTLAFLVDEPGAEHHIDELRDHIPELVHARVHRSSKKMAALLGLIGGGSATMTYFGSAGLHRAIDTRLRVGSFDLIYAYSSSMFQYVPAASRIRLVMDFVDVDSEKWLQYSRTLPATTRWIYRLEGRRLRRHEIAAAGAASRCLVVTRHEEEILRSLAPFAPTTVIPNGVDLEYFVPAPEPSDEPTIVFTGAMDYFPNVDAVTYFTREIFPEVRRSVPHARFQIVGKNPVPAVRRLAAAPGVDVTGSVPDVRPFLQRASIAVAPLRVAQGVQNKILEAMAMGLPVVASSKAHQGLDAARGRDLLVEDDAMAFAEAVNRLLTTPGLRRRLGAAGRAFIGANHTWPAALARLDDVLHDLTPRPATALAAAVARPRCSFGW
ncbi:MAG: TIGR03087 family PEP-CTERM/XrtA system glycosyltransferase [Candidatus Rokuibacteriota bacterium]